MQLRMMHGFDVYRTYLAMKQHFTNDKFDFFQYDGKVRAKETTYQQRPDFYFFETLARKLSDQEVKEYLLASFVATDDPTKVWIGDIKRSGKDRWMAWTKRNESLSYIVKQDLGSVAHLLETQGHSFNNLFETLGQHPSLLKLYVKGVVSLETLIVLDIVLGFTKDWDKKLKDPLWEMLSFKIKKYKPFLSINSQRYRQVLKDTFI